LKSAKRWITGGEQSENQAAISGQTRVGCCATFGCLERPYNLQLPNPLSQ
jgi:hypothetical protein